MPKIKIDHVISFSSEDPVFVANNILSSDPAKKWKCKSPGERSAIIVLQLEKATVISAIDLGNEHSAYVEVLVSRSEASDDYKVLLVMSSFMSPLEARQGTNTNKVRMFSKDQLSSPECNQKWDRVKIVCTQPFNRHVQYGLSFVNLQSPEDKTSAASSAVQTHIGKFAVRPESPDNLSAGSLFARRKELQQQEPLTAAAAIRNAASSASSKAKIKINTPNKASNNSNGDSKPLARNRNELLYSKDEEEANEKIDRVIEKTKESKKKDDNSGESSKRKKDFRKDKSPNKRVKHDVVMKPFGKLLEGVTLVISGIQNPDRANLRSMALAMGAKYKPDWDNSCTHLICAFVNTPKFNQVKGKGKIVKKNWIEECHKQRKRLPWRRYCLDKRDTNKPESEDEIWEETVKKQEEKKSDVSEDDDTDAEGFDDTKIQKRIEEIQAKQKQNIFAADTDEDIETEEKKAHNKVISKKLPDFFETKTFFIDESLDEDIYKTLERYIVAFKGIIAENPSSNVDFFITSEMTVDSLKENFPQSLFLLPDWVWDCHNSQSLVPFDKYKL